MESPKPILDFEKFDDGFVQKLVYDALVWSSLHGLVVSDKTYQRSGTVPEENDFFKVFGPAFKRNARWSVNTRVPNLGDENTPVKEVDSYYNFCVTLGISLHRGGSRMSLNTEQLRKLCDKMENKEGLKLAKVLKNGNNDETESEEEEVVEAKQNGHVEANGIATQSPRAAAMI
ncbi:hypothetical protein Bca52824_042455 [Brassica carinata]|uniref:Zuotin-like zuotin homology domain-containing protein n=1 Tax=Brassica carinata TaxID=52824 RepID=A0A8X7UZR3_BRACI|nr:hypothetical protein Bca52824_042455 [Brassica carinata]